jgi:hypothetical protein
MPSLGSVRGPPERERWVGGRQRDAVSGGGCDRVDSCQADDALIATLTVVSEVATADERRVLLGQLPKSIAQRVPLSSRTVSMRPTEFVARVAELTATNEDTERNVRVVVQVLAEAVNVAHLPRDSEFKTDHLADVAAALTYCSAFATFPTLIVLVNVLRLFAHAAETTHAIFEIIDRVGPRPAVRAFRPR